MVEYFDLSNVLKSSGFVSFMRNMSQLTHELLPNGISFCFFIIPLMIHIRKGTNIYNSLIISSFGTFILSSFFYFLEITTEPIAIILSLIILVASISLAWYNK